jgi:hypothetical protein
VFILGKKELCSKLALISVYFVEIFFPGKIFLRVSFHLQTYFLSLFMQFKICLF